MRRIAARLFLALLTALVLAAGCDSGDSQPRPPPPIAASDLVRHLAALQRIADRAGGERAAGTGGFAASVDYVAGVLGRAGWRVRVQQVPMAGWRERSPATLGVGGTALEPIRDFRVPSYSAAGQVDGALRAVDDGCQAEDYSGLAAGEVAFTGFGGCFLWRKTVKARRAGASALVAQTSTSGPGVASATLAVPRLGLPVVLMSSDVAAREGDRVQLSVKAATTRSRTQNVIAEIGPASGRVVMAGAHLDSVPNGPGINDDGSGVATLLEVARTLGPRPPGRLRLAFWGAEEEGLIGSRRYVRGLSDGERRTIAAYLNLDMVGSPNAVAAVYADGDRRLGRLLRRLHPGSERGALTGNRSDHSAFESAGIPVNGLYTGAYERGPRGKPRDPCYHLPCDTLAHVNRGVLVAMARTTARALAELAQAK